MCDVDILLFDLFGDGWGDSQLMVEIDGVKNNVTLGCGHCSRVSFPDVHCNVSIWMTSADDAVTPWENYWVVNVIGQTLFGGSDSTVSIYHTDVMGMNLIDTNETVNCDECLHPQPKGKGGKGKNKNEKGRKLAKGGKKPPAFANSKLYDEQSNGWFVSSGWTDVCDSCAPGDTNCTSTVPNMPNFLIYPRYFILNEAKTEIIHEGTICSTSRGFELCENVIPHNGDFVFRVAGIEPEGDAATWEFCGKTGGVNQELQFTMKNGACVAGVKVAAADICDGVLSTVVLSGSLLLGGINSAAFSSTDAEVLESDLKLMIPANSIAIKSWTNTGDDLRVHFSANFLSGAELVYYHANVVNFATTIKTDLSTSISSGVFKDQMNLALDALPNTQSDILRSCTEITLEDMTIYSLGFVSASSEAQNTPIEIISMPVETTASTDPDSVYTLTSTAVYVLVTVGIVSVGLVAVAVRVMSRKRTHELLPSESSHESRA
jgi:hypothetical protein